MSNSRPSGNFKACNQFNGRNGNGYQPCRKPVPPDIECPPLQILYEDESPPHDSWTSGFYFGAFIGIIFGMILMKILIKSSF